MNNVEEQKPINSKDELLYSLLQKELGYYSAILDLTKKERQLLAERCGMEALGPIIKKKQIILTHINQIDTALAPLKKYWAQKPLKEEVLNKKIDLAWQCLDKILLEILSVDNHNNKQL